MKENDRIDLIERLKAKRQEMGKIDEFIPEEGKDNVEMLNKLIHSGYTCEHDYGIKSDIFCTCLECGDALKESSYKSILIALPTVFRSPCVIVSK